MSTLSALPLSVLSPVSMRSAPKGKNLLLGMIFGQSKWSYLFDRQCRYEAYKNDRYCLPCL